MTLAVVLIVVGLILLVAEVFIPSGGLLFVLSILAIIAGVLLVFFADPSEGGGQTAGIITLVSLFVLIPTLVGVAFHYWPRTPMGKRFFLPEPDADATIAATPEYLELEQLKGQIGKTATPLRPSGVTLIQGHRIDTKTEGMFVDADQWVRVIDVRSGQVTVRLLADDELQQLPDFS